MLTVYSCRPTAAHKKSLSLISGPKLESGISHKLHCLERPPVSSHSSSGVRVTSGIIPYALLIYDQSVQQALKNSQLTIQYHPRTSTATWTMLSRRSDAVLTYAVDCIGLTTLAVVLVGWLADVARSGPPQYLAPTFAKEGFCNSHEPGESANIHMCAHTHTHTHTHTQSACQSRHE